MTKPFNISKHLVVRAYKLVKANAGSAGVDEQSLTDFEGKLKDNLYKLWNRLSSGSYFPPPVKAVAILKKSGSQRILGIPTVSDRIAQMVVKLVLEPELEPHFLEDSYGYRPNKSALEAIGITRQRCWQYGWLLEFDIKGLFDNIPHSLLMKAVHHHTQCNWVVLYIERWLKAPIQYSDRRIEERNQGTPQGGVISPLLSNLYLHYVFDKWMQRQHVEKPWCRYADDGLVHCKTRIEAETLLEELKQRFAECGLELHSDKTRIVCCNVKDKQYPTKSFDFLGYTFRPRLVTNQQNNTLFIGFTPAVSKTAVKAMRQETKRCKWHLRSELSLEEIAQSYNPVLKGWL
jgi:group II intron reverse transcriptase/maturase